MIETLWQDLRYGFRMLWKSPGFTAVAILALALGIGANTAIFSVVNSVLLRPLPYKDPDRLVMIWNSFFRQGLSEVLVSAPEFVDYREQNQAFEHIAAYRTQGFNFIDGDKPERILGARVSASLFPLLGVQPARGRTFLPEEDQLGHEQVVVLSHGLWQRRFGSDPNLIGRTLTLDGKNVTVVGIMPPGFYFPERDTEVWRPEAFEAEQLSERERGSRFLNVIARLKPGVTLQQAQAEMGTMAHRIRWQHADSYPEHLGFGITVIPRHEQVVRAIRPALFVLLGAVGFVLLIACANVANLLLARATTRQKEIAIRTALGASRRRIIWQLLIESLLLSSLGGALGLLLALWGVDLLVALSPDTIPRVKEIGLDGRVLGFTFVISLLTSLLFGLMPALEAAKISLNESLKEGSRGATEGFRRQRFRGLLVVSEIAMALVLLINAGLMIRSFLRLLNVNLGFNPENVLTMRLSLPESKYPERHQQHAFFEQLLERIERLPGVQSVGAVTWLPLSGLSNGRSFSIEGRPGMGGHPGDIQPSADYLAISTNYLRAMSIPLLKGRPFTDGEAEGLPVVIINETMARRFWPDQDPIGKRIRLGGLQSPFPWLSIVGVVGDVMHRGPDAQIRPEMYVPYLHPSLPNYPAGSMFLVVRTASEPTRVAATVRGEVRAVDKDQPIFNIKTMPQRLAESVAQRRLNMLLLGIFAAVALVLAAVGIYGVMAYSVTQRTHEIGIRMALGAQRGDVLKLVVRQGMSLALTGVVIGLVTAFALTRLMSRLLYGVSATDPATFVVISLLLTGVALVACYIPARRATKVDPMVALRYE